MLHYYAVNYKVWHPLPIRANIDDTRTRGFALNLHRIEDEALCLPK